MANNSPPKDSRCPAERLRGSVEKAIEIFTPEFLVKFADVVCSFLEAGKEAPHMLKRGRQAATKPTERNASRKGKQARSSGCTALSTSDLQAFQAHEVTADERAACTRLVRVMRERQYWVGAFIEWLLNSDVSADEGGIKIESALEMLTELKKLMSWQTTLDTWRKEGSPLHRFYGERLFPTHFQRSQAEADHVLGAGHEEQFGELVRMWRLEHPEPEKPRKLLNVMQ